MYCMYTLYAYNVICCKRLQALWLGGGVINEGLKLLHPLPMLAMFYAIVFSILRCLSDHYSLHILIKFTPSFSELRRNLTSQLIT